ncbi:hypothetical protein [Desertivirga brevis]|uniref:hypothetical protein n=1 Tax=Desertivirga brevis TaxID=2810310 RepID=UPI001A96B9EF|nr:hypothetical protein [Pedobacter sp. SYSU D00873]
MKLTDPDDKDSLIGGDALSDENSSIPKADESLIDDSPLNNEGGEEQGDTTQTIPPPAD